VWGRAPSVTARVDEGAALVAREKRPRWLMGDPTTREGMSKMKHLPWFSLLKSKGQGRKR
jgi:hypothetical protein